MPLPENTSATNGITQILNARLLFSKALQHCTAQPTMQLAEDILGFRPRKFISRYETISHLAYRQQSGELLAHITLQQAPTESCCQFVRFYTDTGAGEWQDAGYTSVLINGTGSDAEDEAQPCHEVRIKWQPGKIPDPINGPARLKAVLCWNVLPPANDPDCEADFPYIWADTRETVIRISPAVQHLPAGYSGKLAVTHLQQPVAQPAPACRKLVTAKPAFKAGTRKKSDKTVGIGSRIVPVYKSKTWQTAI